MIAFLFAIALGLSAPPTAPAAPVFPLPDPFALHPGFGINLLPTGPGFLPPGGALPPVLFSDVIASPDVGHLELEFNNPNPFPITFDITIIFPGGPYATGLFLPAGSSGYFDIGYFDAPPEVGPPMWSLSATAAPGAPIGPGILIDADAIESPVPTHPPGLGFFGSAGPGGPGMLVPLTGIPGVFVTMAPVPEPSTLALLGAGLAGFLSYARMRRRKRA